MTAHQISQLITCVSNRKDAIFSPYNGYSSIYKLVDEAYHREIHSTRSPRKSKNIFHALCSYRIADAHADFIIDLIKQYGSPHMLRAQDSTLKTPAGICVTKNHTTPAMMKVVKTILAHGGTITWDASLPTKNLQSAKLNIQNLYNDPETPNKPHLYDILKILFSGKSYMLTQNHTHQEAPSKPQQHSTTITQSKYSSNTSMRKYTEYYFTQRKNQPIQHVQKHKN